AAFDAAADPARYPEAGPAWTPLKLYEMSFPREPAQQGWEQMRARGMQTPLDRPDFDIMRFTVSLEQITTADDVAAYTQRKRAALIEHRTQIPADSPFFSTPEDIGRQWFGVEYFTLLQSRLPLPDHAGYEQDLF